MIRSRVLGVYLLVAAFVAWPVESFAQRAGVEGAQGQAVAPVQQRGAAALPRGMARITSVEGVTEYRLANGLQLLLVPDPSKPTTTVNMTYRVGSRHESYGETGMAHLLEHLIFKGSKRYRNVWADFTRRGMRANGSTWVDRTNYFASFSSNDENLKWYLDWQADAMVNSFIARADLDTEMTVVRNEMEMGENRPSRVLLERGLAAMYQWHNYGKSTIGARSDVENVDIEQLRAFYRKYYQPDNATLIVAGRFDEQQVLRWVARSFGAIPKPARALPPLYTLDPVQDGERSVTLRRVGGVPLLYAMYHVPPGGHPDFAAVSVLDAIMADAPSGRLHRAMVDAGLASGVFAFSQGLADPGYAVYGAQLGEGKSVEAAERVMLEVLESVAQQPLTEQELERAKARWLKDWDMAFADPGAVGVALSESIAAGDWRLFFLTRDRVRALTLAQVQKVASERLLPANRTLARYIPTEQPLRAPAPERVDVASMLKGYTGDAAQAAAEAFEATPAEIEARTQRFESPNGLRAAVLAKETRGGWVNAQLTLRFGQVETLQGSTTAARLTAALLDKGTRTLSRQEIQDRLDALQAEVAFRGGPSGVTASLTTRRQHFDEAMALVSQMLREPAFPQAAFDEVRRQALAGVEMSRKEPGPLVDNRIDALFNPYAEGDVRQVMSFEQQRRELEAVRLEDVVRFHQRFYGASNAQLAVVGPVAVAQVQEAVARSLGEWVSAEPHQRPPRPWVAVPAQRLAVETPDKQNAYLRISLGVPLNDTHPDYPAFMMANYLLGQGGNSRLWVRVREREGLSYDVGSRVQWSAWEPNSLWTTTAIFAPQNLGRVESALREEIARALAQGFTRAELEEGRRGLLSFRRLSRTQDASVAAALSENLYLGRDFLTSQRVDEALAKLTLDQVNAALRKYLQPDAFVIGVGGDLKQ